MNFKQYLLINEAKEEKALALELAGSVSVLEDLKKFVPEDDQLLLLASYYYSKSGNLRDLETDFTNYINFVKANKMPLLKVNLVNKKPPSPYDNYLYWSQIVHGHKEEERVKVSRKSVPSYIDFQNERAFLTSADGKIKVYEANSPQQCIVLGRGQSFCISQPGNTMWKSYRDQSVSTFYFVYDDTRDDELSIVVIDQTENGTILTDKNNTTGRTKDPYSGELTSDGYSYLEYLERSGIDISKIVNKEKTVEEESEDERLGKLNKDLQWFVDLLPIEKSNYIGRGHSLSDEQFDFLWDNKFKILLEQYVKTGLKLSDYQINKIVSNKDLRDNYIHNRILAQRNNSDLSKMEYDFFNEKQRDFIEDNFSANDGAYFYAQYHDFERMKRIFNRKNVFITRVNECIDFASEAGDLEAVKFLISKGGSEHKALSSALFGKQLEVVDYLLKNVSKKDLLNGKENLGLAAVRNDRPDIIKKLINMGINFDNTINAAAKYGNLNVVKYLKSLGYNKTNASLMKSAIIGHNFEIIKYLEEIGVPIIEEDLSVDKHYEENFEIFKYIYSKCEKTNNHTEVLKKGISSAFHGKFDKIGKFLVEKYLMLAKEPNKNLISHAIQGENLGAIKLLQKHIKMDNDIFREALYKGNLEIIKYLHDLGLRDEDPFMNATGSNNIKVIEYLLEKGYKVNGSNIVEAISVHKIDIGILRLLFKNLKKPINKTYNNLILDEALRRSDEPLYIIKYLIEEENLVLDNQSNAMDLAIMNGKLEVVKYFVSKGAEINSGYVLYPYPNLSSKVRNYLVSVLRDRGEDVT